FAQRIHGGLVAAAIVLEALAFDEDVAAVDLDDGGDASFVGELHGGPAVGVSPGGEDDVGMEFIEGLIEGAAYAGAVEVAVARAEELGGVEVVGVGDGDLVEDGAAVRHRFARLAETRA